MHSPPSVSRRLREHRRFRSRDITALRRLRDQGPLTIPQAYDCGHTDNESNGHGMNRLVAATLVVCSGWDQKSDDGLWSITPEGTRVLHLLDTETNATR